MSTAVQTVNYANVVVFGVLAVVAFWLWQRGRGRPALWAALSFGAVGIVVLDGLVLPDEPENGFQEVVQRVNIALLVLFPYLLYRFTTTFERAPGGLERLARDRPVGDGERRRLPFSAWRRLRRCGCSGAGRRPPASRRRSRV